MLKHSFHNTTVRKSTEGNFLPATLRSLPIQVEHISYQVAVLGPETQALQSVTCRNSLGISTRYSGIYVLTVKHTSERCGTNQPVLVTLFSRPMRLQKNGKVKVQLKVCVQSLASIYCRNPNTSPFPSRSISGLQVYNSSLSNIPCPRITVHVGSLILCLRLSYPDPTSSLPKLKQPFPKL